MPEKSLIDNLIKTGALSGFGGMAYYLYQVHKGEHFRFATFVINVILAFFIGYVVGEFIPDVLRQYEHGIISVSGFLAFPLLDIIEKKVPQIFESYLIKKVGKK